MNRFNLTFSGEILPGRKVEQVKLRFGKMFAIDDPVRLDRFFSGQTIILRRNLDRKTAAEHFQKLRQLGMEVELVKATTEEAAALIAAAPPPLPKTDVVEKVAEKAASRQGARGMDQEIMQRRPGQIDQSWAVSSSATRRLSRAERDQAAAEASRQESERIEQERLQAQEAAREKAEREADEEAERKAAEEAAKRQAEEAEREQARRDEAARKAAEEAVRQRAELAEKKRREEEEAARQQALREEAARKAAEESVRKAEEQRKKAQEKARLQAQRAEQAARKNALKEEARRKAAEEAARRKAEVQRKKKLREETRRKAAEEQARRKAELAEKKRIAAQKAAQEAARIKAEIAEKKRQEAQVAARKQALLDEAKREAAEEVARQQALLREAKRKAAEETAREQALLKEAKRKAAKEAAREQALLKEAKRKAAAEVARLQAEQEEVAREAAEKVARLRAEQEEVARKAAVEVATIHAEQLREQKAEQRRIARLQAEQAATARQAAQEETKREVAAQAAQKRAEKAEQAAQRKAMEDQAVQRAAVELAQQPSLKPARARVKTRLELPQRSHRRSAETAAPTRRRQSGEPNLYSLHPFRNTPEVRARAEQSRGRMRSGYIAAALALAGLLLLGGRFLSLPTAPAITGATGMAIDAQGRPALLAGDSLLFHDRSGVGTTALAWESLGLSALQAPMAFDAAGELLALGRLKTTGAETTGDEPLQLLRCDLTQSLCRPFSMELASSDIAGFAVHTLDGSIFLADASKGQLLRVSTDGAVLGRAPAAIPDHPVLRLESGLLFMNSALGPAVSVFRYDDSAFGQQLDEILLLPPAATAAEQSRVGDFVWSADSCWASMYKPQTDSAGLYRFDAQWSFIEQAELPAGTRVQQLATWGDKTLVRDSHHIPIQRFNAGGALEAPLVSDLLKTLVERRQRDARLTGMAWRSSLILCVLVVIAGLCQGSLQRLRSLVYQPHREHGAAPVDEYVDAVLWVDPIAERRARLGRTAVSYAALAVALLLLAIARQAAPAQLAAALIALCGPAVALLLVGRSSVGHIGILQGQLLLVDHRGMYHVGGGPRIQYRGPFLLLDDVVVFTGTRLLPAFSAKQIAGAVKPLAEGGIRVDRNTVLVKLLQGRHPLALGAVAVLLSCTGAVVVLALQGFF